MCKKPGPRLVVLGLELGLAGLAEDAVIVDGGALLAGDGQLRGDADLAGGARVDLLDLGPGAGGAALEGGAVDAVPGALLVAGLALGEGADGLVFVGGGGRGAGGGQEGGGSLGPAEW